MPPGRDVITGTVAVDALGPRVRRPVHLVAESHRHRMTPGPQRCRPAPQVAVAITGGDPIKGVRRLLGAPAPPPRLPGDHRYRATGVNRVQRRDRRRLTEIDKPHFYRRPFTR